MVSTKFFSREVIGLAVETVAGTAVGVLDDIVIDTENGRIKYLLVKPAGAVINGPAKVDEAGRLVVETDRLRIDGGKVIIN
ncbi:MAG: hypothetical protein PWR17_408 [Candidatus Methanomethylophilaceae archaeon]|nr:hypothetical protein [Candidatus Methanomethylophilaceae archaeon]